MARTDDHVRNCDSLFLLVDLAVVPAGDAEDRVDRFLLMLAGIIINNVAVLNGDASVMMTSYVPMSANPNFYLGLILFAVGALLGCFVFLGTLFISKEEKIYEGSIPPVTFGALTACIIAVFTIASGAIILIPTYLWSLGYINNIDAANYPLVWWALGHSSQQINVAAHVSVWYAIAAIVFGARPLSEKVSRTVFFLYGGSGSLITKTGPFGFCGSGIGRDLFPLLRLKPLPRIPLPQVAAGI